MGAQTVKDSQIAPKHVAIIMDGNGRWAKARGLPRAMGHKHGVENVRAVVEGSLSLGIKYLTLFGFSSENWKRTPTEIFDLMSLLRNYLDNEICELHKKNIRFKVIGDREKLDADIVELIEAAEELTKTNQDLILTVALSYGGRRAIALAAKELAYRACKGTIKLDEISEESFELVLETQGVPNPDLVIRTSGEKRISNFLLWECAYSEFVFFDTLWPDFSGEHLTKAVQEYCSRERRFGAA
ncbi:MAG: di-trans,poly-cis-decaprenylcistransferase [Rhodospirillaceae bacterium]|nr:di-trans,poly-cis-decaprenylcistransferase [Rhodospirillaceae bacterium]|tara:strand:+ start:2972 stop:3697 length:726 start_codon:yes stop_codon:yes gene_type:complete